MRQSSRHSTLGVNESKEKEPNGGKKWGKRGEESFPSLLTRQHHGTDPSPETRLTHKKFVREKSRLTHKIREKSIQPHEKLT